MLDVHFVSVTLHVHFRINIEMKWNEIDYKVREAEKASGTENTSYWSQTSNFLKMAECGSLHETKANDIFVGLIERHTWGSNSDGNFYLMGLYREHS